MNIASSRDTGWILAKQTLLPRKARRSNDALVRRPDYESLLLNRDNGFELANIYDTTLDSSRLLYA